ncbi:MAG: alpha/beta hydrolase [Bacteroidota bacterium]
MVETKKVEIAGNEIYYRYRPGSTDHCICFLHGYPTSSLDYAHLFDSIPQEYHVVAHDFLGFGYSAKPIQNGYQLTDQADLTIALYQFLKTKKIHIVAHDYGTSVATELIARHNEGDKSIDLQSITLCNGSMLIDMSKLRVIQRLLKNPWIGNIVAQLSTAKTFHGNMKNIWFDKNAYDKESMQEHWELLTSNHGRKVLSTITRYIDQRYKNYDRWIGGLKDSTLPFHILWAENDPVAIVEMAYKLEDIIQNAKLRIIQECGHYPMIEKGEEWLGYVLGYIKDR